VDEYNLNFTPDGSTRKKICKKAGTVATEHGSLRMPPPIINDEKFLENT
jgi:hypothetical protein